MRTSSAQCPVQWIHEVEKDGEVAFRAGKRGTDMVADWPGLGTLTCARDGTAAKFSAAPGASLRAISKLQGGQVRGLLCDLAGQLAIHASAVAIQDRAVVFLGSDGAGKSTAAAEMCLHHGAQMLADDVASVEVRPGGVYVVPSEGDHWLTRESRLALGVPQPRGKAGYAKRNLRASNVASRPARLGLMVALRFDPSLKHSVRRALRGSDAARQLLEAVIRFDLEDRRARSREFEQLTAVYRCASFVELLRPLGLPGGVAAHVFDAAHGSSREAKP